MNHQPIAFDRRIRIAPSILSANSAGQKFIPARIAQIRRLRAMIGDRPAHIEIDGGVTPETAPVVATAGADVLVAGSAVSGGGSVADPTPYGANIRAIRAAAEAALQEVADAR